VNSIAEIEIMDKMSEIDEPSPKTLFNAKIVKVFKGETTAAKIIVLR